jgi:hypothetical protein
LNHERYAEEVKMGLHEKSGKSKGNGKKNGREKDASMGKGVIREVQAEFVFE